MASSPQHEPTMEEILASIRKIISEDSNEAPAAADAPTHNAPVAVSEPEESDADVLELTQEVHEEPVSPPQAPAPVVEHAPEPVPEPVHVAPEPEPEPASEPDVVFVSHEETTVSSSDHDDSGIFSEKSRKAIDDAFAGLDDVEDEPAAETPRMGSSMPTVEGDSVEAVFERAVRSSVEPLLNNWMDGRKDELMNAVKPLIRDWMDEHFPALLEGAVREEVARVVKARGRR